MTLDHLFPPCSSLTTTLLDLIKKCFPMDKQLWLKQTYWLKVFCKGWWWELHSFGNFRHMSVGIGSRGSNRQVHSQLWKTITHEESILAITHLGTHPLSSYGFQWCSCTHFERWQPSIVWSPLCSKSSNLSKTLTLHSTEMLCLLVFHIL